LFENFCPVHLMRPLWGEDVFVVCPGHSQ
jgi:hypothetical protein